MPKDLILPDGSNLDLAPADNKPDRLELINDACVKEFLGANNARDKERAFRMALITHTVLKADEGATEESLVKSFLLSRPGLMSILKDKENMRNLYNSFEQHMTMHSATHLLLSPEGFVAQLRRIAAKANRKLAKHTGKPSYFKEGK